MRLWTLFISYRFGGHYCGVYPSIKTVAEVIKEMVEDVEIDDDFIPSKKVIEKHLFTNDDYYYEFNDGTWIQVQETSPALVEMIVEEVISETRGTKIN